MTQSLFSKFQPGDSGLLQEICVKLFMFCVILGRVSIQVRHVNVQAVQCLLKFEARMLGRPLM